MCLWNCFLGSSCGRVRKEREFRAELPLSTAAVLPANHGPAVGFTLCLHTCTSTFKSKKASTIDKDKEQPEEKGTMAICKRFIALHLEPMSPPPPQTIEYYFLPRPPLIQAVGIGGSTVGLFLLIIILGAQQ